ncbi:hypothetical protein CM19_03975 [Candidatus Acidianus copahuensis]|uniref:TRASH domain-containing protein n=1 Tax=Candidatus Acidianus copahuensis TaxID=1160895 RepID=A0A031LT12_9CREN|nr:SelT/SelW/SelH family protein [Candidatus Acidianus copahuensis]EZQ10594.1 hypothetical protein CM19_03975 [Candidatus Acidianus copahuensis]
MIDPVCKMEVEVSDLKLDYNGKTYYFCSTDCLNEFRESPEKYINKKEELQRRVNIRIVYCRPCKYLDRALNLSKDLLSYFEEADVTLVQGNRGIFDVYVDGNLIFSRFKEGRFPESEEILKEVSKKIKENKEN